jgi:hypothetical protein
MRILAVILLIVGVIALAVPSITVFTTERVAPDGVEVIRFGHRKQSCAPGHLKPLVRPCLSSMSTMLA